MKRKTGGAKKAEKGSFRDYLRSSEAMRVLICVVGILLMVALFEVAIVPTRYQLKVGMVPNVTIAATKDVVDEISTEKKREEAAEKVVKTYRYQESITNEVLTMYDQIFAQLRAVRQYASTLEDASSTRVYTKDELQYGHEMLTLLSLSDYQLTSLMRSTKEELEEAYTLVYAALQSTMQSYVTEGQESAAIYSIRQIVNYRISIPLGQNVIPAVLNACVQANILVDQEKTEEDKQAARDAVEPVMYKQGQNIVVRGEGRITENQLAMLSTLGLLSDSEVDMTIYVGAVVLAVFVLTCMVLLLRHYGETRVMSETDRLLLTWCVLVISFALCLLGRIANAYLVPLILCPLLLTALLGLRVGVVCNAALNILVAAVAAGGSEEYAEKVAVILISGLLSGTITALMMNRKTSRLWVLLSGLTGCAVDFISIMCIGLMTSSELTGSIINAGWRAGGSAIGTLLCIGLQPLLEMIFNMPTPMKLMELSNPNQPLLRRMLLEAPGTYHHCTIVASIAEAAAESIGANPLICRVGGYYHDVGKLKRPSYFTENQTGGVNIHDHTDPYVSAAIITSHTRDGVALARAYRLPRAIQQIIAEHHGNTPVMFFYHKALQQANGKPVDINNFRYDGRPPRTKEGAIVMLCDTIEAAVRTMKNPTTDGIEEFIVKLVRGKLEDGQLNDSPLTLRDIDRICAAATQVLLGVFHERIEYPDLDEIKAQAMRQAAIDAGELQTEGEIAEKEPDEDMAEWMVSKPATVVTPEASPQLTTVEPMASAKLVSIQELVQIEPLPTKEMEAEMLAREKAESQETAEEIKETPETQEETPEEEE